jgi:hypothetical protein
MINLPGLQVPLKQQQQELALYFERERLVAAARVIEYRVPLDVTSYDIPVKAGANIISVCVGDGQSAEVRPKAGSPGQWLTIYNNSVTGIVTLTNNPLLRLYAGFATLQPLDSVTLLWTGTQWNETTRGAVTANGGGGGGGGAPTGATYVTLTPDAVLTGERTLKVSAGLSLTDGGANADLTLGVTPNGISSAMFRAASANSVVGRTAGVAGNVGDIPATTDGTVLRLSGSLLAFGALALGNSSAVTGVIGIGHGGTGATDVAGARGNLSVYSKAEVDALAGTQDVLWVGTGAPADPVVELWADTDEVAEPIVGPPGPQGPQGPQGNVGPPGPPGPGVAVGGTAGQVLSKIDATNYNTQWTTPTVYAPLGAPYVTTASDPTLTGETVLGASGGLSLAGATLSIADNGVTNAKLADIATARIKGRVTAATGDPEDLTGTQVTTLLDTFTTALKGLVPPATGGGTVNYLRADGAWAAPPGSAGGAPSSAQYLTLAADATLSAERVFSATSPLNLATTATTATLSLALALDQWLQWGGTNTIRRTTPGDVEVAPATARNLYVKGQGWFSEGSNTNAYLGVGNETAVGNATLEAWVPTWAAGKLPIFSLASDAKNWRIYPSAAGDLEVVPAPATQYTNIRGYGPVIDNDKYYRARNTSGAEQAILGVRSDNITVLNVVGSLPVHINGTSISLNNTTYLAYDKWLTDPGNGQMVGCSSDGNMYFARNRTVLFNDLSGGADFVRNVTVRGQLTAGFGAVRAAAYIRGSDGAILDHFGLTSCTRAAVGTYDIVTVYGHGSGYIKAVVTPMAPPQWVVWQVVILTAFGFRVSFANTAGTINVDTNFYVAVL